MKSYIVNKLNIIKQRKKKIESLLIDNNIISNKNLFKSLSKEYSKLYEITICFDDWLKVKENINNTKQLIQDLDMYEIAQDELNFSKKKKQQLENKLNILLLPKNPCDKLGCFLEIRAGTGGNEASLFVRDLFRMYSKFIETKHWKLEIISSSYGEKGGFKEIIAKIKNKGAYGILKFESGGHRVQRIPETESQGRIHTSTCTVAVIQDIPEKNKPKINSNDLRIDTFRSSGAGGQHVNTTDSAIRITHIPTGLVVECQNERSQHKNKAKAISVLEARLCAIEAKHKQFKESLTRKNLLGTGDRFDRIRTYNYPKCRITDHRINLTLYKLEEIIEGKLDLLIKPIIQENQNNQLNLLFNK